MRQFTVMGEPGEGGSYQADSHKGAMLAHVEEECGETLFGKSLDHFNNEWELRAIAKDGIVSCGIYEIKEVKESSTPST